MPETSSPGLLRRLAALVYDTCLILPLVMFCTAAVMGLQMVLGNFISGPLGEQTLNPHLVQALALLSFTAFYTSFWTLKGQTLGMQAWRIRLRSLRGDTVTVKQALLRCLGATVSLLAGGAGYWWCLFDARARTWHDHLSGTELILLPKKDKKKKG